MRLLLDVLVAVAVVLDGYVTWRFLRWPSPHFHRFAKELSEAREASSGEMTKRLFFNDARFLWSWLGAALVITACYAQQQFLSSA